MLKTDLLHPRILAAIAGAGHGSLILIADANYPVSTTRGPNAEVVYLNLAPGTIDAVTIASAITGAIPIEEALVMAPMTEGPYAMASDPPIWTEFEEALKAAGNPLPLTRVERNAFYEMAGTSGVALTIASGETRLYGNLFLRIGVRQPR